MDIWIFSKLCWITQKGQKKEKKEQKDSYYNRKRNEKIQYKIQKTNQIIQFNGLMIIVRLMRAFEKLEQLDKFDFLEEYIENLKNKVQLNYEYNQNIKGKMQKKSNQQLG